MNDSTTKDSDIFYRFKSSSKVGKQDLRELFLSIYNSILNSHLNIHRSWVEVFVPGQLQETVKHEPNSIWVRRMVNTALFSNFRKMPQAEYIDKSADLIYFEWMLSREPIELQSLLEAMLWRMLSKNVRNSINPNNETSSKKKLLNNDAVIQLLGNEDLPENILNFFKDKLSLCEESLKNHDRFQENCLRLFQLWVSIWPPSWQVFLKVKRPFHPTYNSLLKASESNDTPTKKEMRRILNDFYINNHSFHEFFSVYRRRA